MAEEFTPIMLERAAEQLRQERETFEQQKRHEERWFRLRLVMGYAAVVLLTVVMVMSSLILVENNRFPTSVVVAAGTALFVDVLGLLVGVWKIALNPTFLTRLGPVTTGALGTKQVSRSRSRVGHAVGEP